MIVASWMQDEKGKFPYASRVLTRLKSSELRKKYNHTQTYTMLQTKDLVLLWVILKKSVITLLTCFY